jgi:hypothetical protein
LNLKKIFTLAVKIISDYLNKLFTGRITIHLDCKNGNIYDFEIESKQKFNKKSLDDAL